MKKISVQRAVQSLMDMWVLVYYAFPKGLGKNCLSFLDWRWMSIELTLDNPLFFVNVKVVFKLFEKIDVEWTLKLISYNPRETMYYYL